MSSPRSRSSAPCSLTVAAFAFLLSGLAFVQLIVPGRLLAQQPPSAGLDAKKAKPAPAPGAKVKKGTSGQSAQEQSEGGPKTPAMPNATQMAILIQTFMVGLSQANLTNNFTVLYALSAPSFQKENPPEKLSQTFSGFRAKGIDLTPIILYSPTLTQPPVFVASELLRITGYYKTAPHQIHFDLLLQPFEGAWRLFGISVSTRPAPPEGAPPK